MTDITLESSVEYLATHGQGWALGVLFLSSVLEYVFPPFPGDTVTLAGGVLAYVGAWNPLFILASLTVGTLAGAAADFWLGLRILSPKRLSRHSVIERHRLAMDKVLRGYKRYGPAFLLFNRFMPGIRAFFFVAAGMAGIKFRWVALYAMASSIAWNLLILGAGFLIGENLPLLEKIFSTWSTGIWVVFLSVVAWQLVRWVRKKTRGQRIDGCA